MTRPKTPNDAPFDRVVADHATRVRATAANLVRRLPASVEREDLEQEADSPDYLGECARRNADPLVVLERSAFRQGLAKALAGLEAQAQKVLHLYYGMGWRMHEIGESLGVSESRVSQLHTHAIVELRAALQSPDARFSMLKPRSKPR